MHVATPADIGAFIRERRKALGIDQKTLADRVGVGRTWIIAIEKGKTRAELGLVLRTLRALDIAVDLTSRSLTAAAEDGLQVDSPDLASILDRLRSK